MKSVAIYGFAPQTRGLIEHSNADEVWSLNCFYNFGLDESRVTRTFEIHNLWHHWINRELPGADYYWRWLREKHPFCVYVPKVRQDFVDDYYRIKAICENGYGDLGDDEKYLLSQELKQVEIAMNFFRDVKGDIRRYPLEAIMDDTIPLIPHIDTGLFPERGIEPYYISSIDYMIALAIYERFDRIELYGVELREQTEWAMQKSGATFWVGFARGRGIDVYIPKKSVLMSAPLYGKDEGDQMIPIQIPEMIRREMQKEFDSQRNIHNHLSGKFSFLMDQLKSAEDEAAKEKTNKEISNVREQIENAWRKMYMALGSVHVLTHLIDNENMELDVGDLLVDITRLETIVVGEDNTASAVPQEA